MTYDQRSAEPGELCTCGRQAAVVYLFPDRDERREIGDCGIRDGGRADGPCPFCGALSRHRELYGGTAACPAYTLRPDGVIPPDEVWQSLSGTPTARWGQSTEQPRAVPLVYSGPGEVEVGEYRLSLDVAEQYARRILAAVTYQRAADAIRDGAR